MKSSRRHFLRTVGAAMTTSALPMTLPVLRRSPTFLPSVTRAFRYGPMPSRSFPTLIP